MRKLRRYISPHAFMIAMCVTVKFLASVSELFIPKLLAQIIDSASTTAEVYFLGGIMLLFAVFALAGNIVANCLSTKNACDITRSIRSDLFSKINSLSAKDGDQIGTSSLVSRLTSDTYNFNEMIARIQRIGIRAPILMIGGIVMSLTLNVKMTLVMIILVPVVFAVSFFITLRGIPLYDEEQRTLDRVVRVVQENAGGVRVIKALSKTEYEKDRFHRESDDLVQKEIRAGRLMACAKPINTLVLNLGLCAVIVVGAVGVNRGTTEPGVILAFLTYFTIILNAMITVTRVFIQFSRASASGSRIAEVLECPESMPVMNIPEIKEDAHIVFDHVSFSYDGVQDNLTDISFTLGRGDTLGIIGSTGSGKSTLISLLMRFYDPDSGSIRIDGRDIRSMQQSDLRERFGVVFQNDFVMTGTARENVSFFRRISSSDMEKAVMTAQAKGFVDISDTDTVISSRGTNISGGQKQRLLISRALAAPPQILVLDDSSSALDYATDLRLRRALGQNYPSVTSVIVAQRVSSVKHADIILVLDDGKVIGKGTHSQLMQTCPEYSEIAHIQMGGEADA